MRRITQFIALLCVVFGPPAICCCQVKIPLWDVSGQGCPIRVSGQVSFQDDPTESPRYAYRIEGAIENVSTMGVVLTVIHVEARGVNAHGLDANRSSEDHFFSPKDLQPGEEEAITSSKFAFGESAADGRSFGSLGGDAQFVPDVVGSDKTPLATAKVTFVQFADGSTWGDTAAGRATVDSRIGTLTELVRYQRVLDEEGISSFSRAFAGRDTMLSFPLVFRLIAGCKGKPDSCLIDGMHSMVQAARQHQVDMKVNRTTSDVRLDQPR